MYFKFSLRLMLFFYILFFTSCEVELLPYEAYEPLITDPKFTFDAKTVNNKCEIYYYEQGVAEDAYYRNNIKENLIYKAFQEWNNTGANVKFTFETNLNLCNISIWKDSPIGIPYKYEDDELGLIKINGDINQPPYYPLNKHIEAISPDYTEFNLFGRFTDVSPDNRYRRRILLYLIGKYLGLPDSKNKESCMYPYLVKDGSLGKITDEDIALLKQLRPSSPCGKVSIEMKSNTLNTDGSLNFSVAYNNSNSQSKVENCGIVISEDSTSITLERNAYFLSTSNQNNQEFIGKTTKLNAQTKYFAKAFSVDENGVSYSKNITKIQVPNRLHDKWIPIKLSADIRLNKTKNDYFEYDGKLYTGFEVINEQKYLNQINLLTGEVVALIPDNFPFPKGEYIHVDEYLYYVNKEKTLFETDFLFARLSLKTLKWEILKNSSVNQRFDFAISFNQGDNIFIQKANTYDNIYFPLEKYNISTNTWTNAKASTTYPQFYNFPISQNNQFYFSHFKINKFEAYNPVFNEWKTYDLQAQFNISQAETLKMFTGLAYVEIYTIPYQNQLVTYFYNRNENRYINNGLTSNDNNSYKYDLLPYPIPSIYAAINSPYKSYERQSLIALNSESRSYKNLCNPPEPFRLKHLDELSYQTFLVSSGENLYLGFGYDANKCNTIYRYIP
jgi:hypothetical protein